MCLRGQFILYAQSLYLNWWLRSAGRKWLAWQLSLRTWAHFHISMYRLMSISLFPKCYIGGMSTLPTLRLCLLLTFLLISIKVRDGYIHAPIVVQVSPLRSCASSVLTPNKLEMLLGQRDAGVPEVIITCCFIPVYEQRQPALVWTWMVRKLLFSNMWNKRRKPLDCNVHIAEQQWWHACNVICRQAV